MPVKLDAAVLDADFAIKVGRMESKKIIEEVIPVFIEALYIHKYVYDNEILTPPNVKLQLENLISQRKAFIVDQEFLAAKGHNKELIYQQTRDFLKANHGDSTSPRKNWGEIVSLAFAKAEGIT